MAASKKSLFDIKDVNNNIEVISNNYNIPKILQNTDLYIGVSSSIIYELSYLNILSVIFPTIKNQK